MILLSVWLSIWAWTVPPGRALSGGVHCWVCTVLGVHGFSVVRLGGPGVTVRSVRGLVRVVPVHVHSRGLARTIAQCRLGSNFGSLDVGLVGSVVRRRREDNVQAYALRGARLHRLRNGRVALILSLASLTLRLVVSSNGFRIVPIRTIR